VLARDGRLLAAFQHAVERTWPAAGGVTSLARSQAADPAVVDAVAGMLRRAGFWGLAQVDLVAGGDRPVVLDVNTRFYGSMALAVACGVNLPAAWHAAAGDRPWPEQSSYRCGLGFWWAEADVRTLRALRRPPGDHVGPLWQAGDLAAGGMIQATGVLAELRARLR
jgi:predicted ATP-grasp superfamily ATP-dependent carboligase